MAQSKRRKHYKIKYSSQIKEILVINDKKLKPYLELLNFEPTNINQKKLGKLVGIFEIKSANDSVAYIVNFLVSVAKKEYFINPKRSPEKSFEATLNKLNLAFSELAKHNNLDWLGKTNIALASLEKNNLFFSTLGSAKILLFRDQSLSEISYNEKKESLHPLKMFSDISSGKLKDKDKLILTTEDIFQFLSLKEIEKKARFLSSQKFNRFLKTALVNELMGNVSLILDFVKKKEIVKKIKKSKKRITPINAFSSKTFEEKVSSPNLKKEKKKASKKDKQQDYIDKKTGHIYIQGKNHTKNKKSSLKKKPFFNLKIKARKEYLNKINKFLKTTKKNITLKKISFERIHIKNKSKKIIVYFYEKSKILFNNIYFNLFTAIKKIKTKEIKKEKNNVVNHNENKFIISERENFNLSRTLNKLDNDRSVSYYLGYLKNFSTFLRKGKYKLKKFFFLIRQLPFWPNFSRLKKIFLHFNLKQKSLALALLLFIIFYPLLLNRFFSKKHNHSSEKIAGEFTTNIPSDNENKHDNKNKSSLMEKIIYTHLPTESLFLLPYKNNLFVVTKNKIILINELTQKKEKEYNFDLKNNEKIYQATFMPDLNLIFLLTNKNKLFSFSPVSYKIKTPQIKIPGNAKINALGTYLTYLYLVDSQHQQIYRYPRAEGGFGDKIDWLKEKIDLNNVTSIFINGEIYLLYQNNQIKKLSHGKTEKNLNLTKYHNITNTHQFYITEKNDFYIHDKTEGVLLKINPQKNIIETYQNSLFKKTHFIYFLKEQQKDKNYKGYLLTDDNQIISFSF